MSNVQRIDDLTYSISALARMAGIDRATVKKYMDKHGVSPNGAKSGNPVYSFQSSKLALAIADAMGHVAAAVDDDIANNNPDMMDPITRKAWFESEKNRLHVQREQGMLLRVEDVEQTWASAFKKIAGWLETLPDVLERDAGLDGSAIEIVIATLDTVRNAFAEEFANTDSPAAQDS